MRLPFDEMLKFHGSKSRPSEREIMEAFTETFIRSEFLKQCCLGRMPGTNVGQ
jgi:hypothetical protein